MIVTPDTFRQHLRILKQRFELLPLAKWIERRDAGQPLPARACAVTFDDGWLDNYEHALPILQQEQVPATLFAVSHMIGTAREFWPNRLARILNSTQQRDAYTSLDWLKPLEGYRGDGTLNREAIAAIIYRCKSFSDDDLNAQLNAAETELQLEVPQTPALMSWEQLRAMQQSGLVEIGSHTCNHYRLLETLPAAALAREIGESRQLLEQQLDKPVNLFCYPNGDVCAAAIAQVRQHYRAAVTTRRGINTGNTAAHELLRIGVHEDISNSPTRFQARLSGWL